MHVNETGPLSFLLTPVLHHQEHMQKNELIMLILLEVVCYVYHQVSLKFTPI